MNEPHKELTWRLRNTRWQGSEWATLMFEAADEIERLRRELHNQIDALSRCRSELATERGRAAHD